MVYFHKILSILKSSLALFSLKVRAFFVAEYSVNERKLVFVPTRFGDKSFWCGGFPHMRDIVKNISFVRLFSNGNFKLCYQTG